MNRIITIAIKGRMLQCDAIINAFGYAIGHRPTVTHRQSLRGHDYVIINYRPTDLLDVYDIVCWYKTLAHCDVNLSLNIVYTASDTMVNIWYTTNRLTKQLDGQIYTCHVSTIKGGVING